MNKEGYRTRYNKKFTYQSFQHLLRNPKYIGEYYVKDKLYSKIYPQLLDKALFDSVQEILKENCKSTNGGKKADPLTYALSGRVFCGECLKRGVLARMNGTPSYKKGTPHYYMSCSNNYAQRRTCNKLAENNEVLETVMVDTIIQDIKANIDLVFCAMECAHDYAMSFEKEVIKPIKEEIAAIEKRISIATDKYVTATNPAVIKNLETQIEAYSLKIEILNAKLKKLMQQNSIAFSNQSAQDVANFIAVQLFGDVRSPKFRKRIISQFVNAVYVYNDHIEIVYSFHNEFTKLSVPLRTALPAAPLGVGMVCLAIRLKTRGIQ